jgi:multicomponent K+:H+ antiporter subunit D
MLASRTAPPTSDAARLIGLGTAVAFAVALACIYAATSTFDAAALSRLAPAAAPPALVWLQTAAYVLFGAFTLSTFALPLALSPPGGAGAAPVTARLAALAPAALGAVSVMRLYSLEFPCFSAGPCGAVSLALPTGLAVLAGGALAMLLARDWRELTTYLVLVPFGVLWIAIGGWRLGTLAAGVYFLPHAVLAGAALMLGGEMRRRGPTWLFAATLLLAAGVPPTAGFVGLVAVLEASTPDALAVWTLLATSMLLAASAMLGMRAETAPPAPGAPPRAAAATALLLLVAFSAAARPAYDFALATAQQLFDRSAYLPPALTPVGSGRGAGHTAAAPGPRAPAIGEAT